jgi:hypothetical protein
MPAPKWEAHCTLPSVSVWICMGIVSRLNGRHTMHACVYTHTELEKLDPSVQRQY